MEQMLLHRTGRGRQKAFAMPVRVTSVCSLEAQAHWGRQAWRPVRQVRGPVVRATVKAIEHCLQW